MGYAGASEYNLSKYYRKLLQPPRYEDVNRDGIPDKIIQHPITRYSVWGSYPTVEEEVLYGTGLELNGKPLFLPKGLYEAHAR